MHHIVFYHLLIEWPDEQFARGAESNIDKPWNKSIQVWRIENYDNGNRVPPSTSAQSER